MTQGSKSAYYLLLFGMAVFSVLGDWLLVVYAKQKCDCRYMLLGFASCNVAIACFLGTLYLRTLFQTSVNFDVITTAALMVLSIVVLKEKIAPEAFFWAQQPYSASI